MYELTFYKLFEVAGVYAGMDLKRAILLIIVSVPEVSVGRVNEALIGETKNGQLLDNAPV